MPRNGTVHIGTSGWHYRHWKGVFYPEGLKDADQLAYYTRSFATVELNNPFYRVPLETTFEKWKATAPRDFLFSVKANRRITHYSKLGGIAEFTDGFIQRAARLGRKLGPILFQLPPFWTVHIQRLATFITTLPRGHRYVFEFRNHSWYIPEVYDILSRHNCAFCIYELAGHLSPIEITADFVYVRLHGPGEKYQGSYSDTALAGWAEHCHQWRKAGKDVFFYFDNDQHAYAVDNAKKLIELTALP